jgi:hypothetical protein
MATWKEVARLSDLDPKWIRHDPKWNYEKNQRPLGLRFKCPLCLDTQLCVLFLNPVDGGPPAPNDASIPGNDSGRRWARSGMEFEEMSLSPSLDVPGHGHWWLRDGLLYSAGLKPTTDGPKPSTATPSPGT